MPCPFVFHPDYVCPLPDGHRFPMSKFGKLAEAVVERGLATWTDFHEPQPATPEILHHVHTPAYVDAFLTGTLDDKAIKRIGLPWSPALALRTRTAVGGTLLTARLALKHGLACNLAGGTHHAFPDFGSGFCIFNDIAIAARTLQQTGEAKHILIIDLDVHQGDATAFVFQHDPHVYTLSIHGEKQFPLKKQQSNYDLELPVGTDDATYLRVLEQGDTALGGDGTFRGIRHLVESLEPDLVIYDAGVDVHRDDRLGKLSLTNAGVAARDRHVILTCLDLATPVACVIGGGYDHDHTRLAKRHMILHEVAFELA